MVFCISENVVCSVVGKSGPQACGCRADGCDRLVLSVV